MTLCSFCAPEEIGALHFSPEFGKYARYHPILSNKEKLIQLASRPDANVTLAVTPRGEMVGAAVLAYPSSRERWHRVGERVMMEVMVIEVNRKWRSLGIAHQLMRLLMDHPLREDRIFYMVGYSWTWDLEGTGLTVMEYRNMLMRFFQHYGFDPYPTNEPNIALRPENLFMARIGSRISDPVRRKFKLVRFNMDVLLEET